MSSDRHFEPISWLYGLLTRAVFGPPRGAAEEEREWERAEPATLAAALRALDARAAALEALVDPDGTTARPPYDAAEFLATLSRCARLADWLHAPAYDVALRVRRLQWAAKLPLNEAAADDDADARAGLALVRRRRARRDSGFCAVYMRPQCPPISFTLFAPSAGRAPPGRARGHPAVQDGHGVGRRRRGRVRRILARAAD